jgi:hypothetical protein
MLCPEIIDKLFPQLIIDKLFSRALSRRYESEKGVITKITFKILLVC